MPIAWLGELLEESAPHISHDVSKASTTSISAVWFLHPQQHVVEFLALNFILIPLLWVLSGHPWRIVSHKAGTQGDGARHLLGGNDAFWGPVEALAKFTCVGTMCSTIVYKWVTSRMLYLFQPCHVLNAGLIYLAFNPGRFRVAKTGADLPSIVFAVYLHSMYGGWLGLCLPDTRDLKMPGEVVSFFTQHVLLCFLPIFYIARGRYNMYAPRIFYCWAFKFLYHSNVLLPLSIVFSGNLNYMMVPPQGPLLVAGRFYRPVMGAVCVVLTVVMRLVLVNVCQWAFVRRVSPKQE